MHVERTTDSDTASTYQVSLVQLMTGYLSVDLGFISPSRFTPKDFKK